LSRFTEVALRLVEELGLPAGVEDVALEIPPMRDPARPAAFD
jgi:hypothetical protein